MFGSQFCFGSISQQQKPKNYYFFKFANEQVQMKRKTFIWLIFNGVMEQINMFTAQNKQRE